MNEELTLATADLRHYTSVLVWSIPVLLNECDP